MKDTRPIRVLIVDNEVDAREWLAEWLCQTQGFNVTTASDGAEAMASLQEDAGNYDVILMDIRLRPGQDGIATMKTLREQYPDVQVIIATGFGGIDDGLKAMSEGAYSYVVKPLNRDEIAIYIRSAAERRRMKAALAAMTSEREWLQSILEISNAVQGTLHLDQALKMIVDGIHQLGYDRVRLYLLEKDSLVGKMQSGDELPSFEGLVLPLHTEAFSRHTLETKTPAIYKHDQFGEDPYETTLAKGGLEEWAELPLLAHGQSVGKLTVDNKYSRRRISERELELFMLFANQAAIAIENAHLYDAAQRRIQDLEIINSVVRVVNTELDTEPLFKTIVTQIANQLHCSHCTLFFLQDKNDEALLVPRTTHGARAETITRCFRPNEGLAGWVFQHGESLVVDNVMDDPRFAPARIAQSLPRSMLVAPVKVGAQTIGVISADQDAYGWFSDSDRRLVDTLAQQIGIAIQRAVGLELVRDIGNRINSAQNVEEILQLIVSGAITLTSTTSGVIYLIGEDRRSVVASWIHPADAVHPIPRLDRENGLTRQIVETGETMIFPDINQDARVNPDLHGRVQSMIAVPLKREEKVIGVLYLNATTYHDFTEIEVSLLSTLANQAAIAIENARLFAQFKEAKKTAEIVAQVTVLGDRKATLDYVVRGTQEAVGCDAVTLFVYDQAATKLGHPPTMVGVHFPERVTRFGEVLTDSLVYAMLKRDEPYFVESTAEDPLFGGRRFVIEEGIRSCVAIPLKVIGQKVGVMFVNYRTYHHFTGDEIANITLFANQAAVAIRNAQLYDELRRTQGLVGARTFLAWVGMVSTTWRHTIENHAITIRAQTQLLRSELEKVASHELDANRRLDSIERLTSQILEKPITPPLSAEEGVRSVPLNELIRERIRQLQSTEPCKSIPLQLHFTLDETATVRASPEWLRQALDILVDNAVEAMDESTHRLLTITSRKVSDGAEILVSDTGTGIPENLSSKLLMEPIKKPRGAKGLGMGLLIAQTIVQTYGGEIRVHSTGSSGTTMAIQLPLEWQETQTVPPVSARFLLISHNEETTWPPILKEALVPLGEVEFAEEEIAPDQVTQTRYDAIVVDASAIENTLIMISRLRQQCPQTPIVVVTASPTWQRARDALLAGASDYVHKTHNKSELLIAMKHILSQPQFGSMI